MKRTPAMRAVEDGFLQRTQKALADVGCSSLEFMAQNTGLSVLELARRLNRGASGFGMTIAIYREAQEKGVVRDTAKNLLIGEILVKFPHGWSSSGSVHPAVKIGSWHFDILNYVSNPRFAEYASRIDRELSINKQPPEGWKPAVQDDPLINDLFDRFWPADEA
ncbi:MAG TPA: hypothetical protein VND64_34320 [Pirellulales bacterium]|nr:hypothetical protein [Pirellulales bacterium]